MVRPGFCLALVVHDGIVLVSMQDDAALGEADGWTLMAAAAAATIFEGVRMRRIKTRYITRPIWGAYHASFLQDKHHPHS